MKYVISIVVLVAFMAISALLHFATMETLNPVTINKTERVYDNGSSRYLIFTENETFENVDSWWSLKLNSSDLYGKLAVGDVCIFKVVGWRISLISSYRNVITADCVNAN